MQEFLKFCKVFAVPLNSKKCLAIFRQAADRGSAEGPKQMHLDFEGFKTVLLQCFEQANEQRLESLESLLAQKERSIASNEQIAS